MISSLIIIGATLLCGMVAIFGLANGVFYALEIVALACLFCALLVAGGAL
jgi:hypothetical protein